MRRGLLRRKDGIVLMVWISKIKTRQGSMVGQRLVSISYGMQ